MLMTCQTIRGKILASIEQLESSKKEQKKHKNWLGGWSLFINRYLRIPRRAKLHDTLKGDPVLGMVPVGMWGPKHLKQRDQEKVRRTIINRFVRKDYCMACASRINAYQPPHSWIKKSHVFYPICIHCFALQHKDQIIPFHQETCRFHDRIVSVFAPTRQLLQSTRCGFDHIERLELIYGNGGIWQFKPVSDDYFGVDYRKRKARVLLTIHAKLREELALCEDALSELGEDIPRQGKHPRISPMSIKD
jgi:hypothetical protein